MEKEPLFNSNPEKIEIQKIISEDLDCEYNLDNFFAYLKIVLELI